MKTGRVVHVWDGDGVQLVMEGKVLSCRLMNLDAPEMDQPFGEESKRALADLLLNKVVEVKLGAKDFYKRNLANFQVNGTWVDDWMISNGFAWFYEHFSDDYKLKEKQDQAIEEKKGLWNYSFAVAPWDWRKMDWKGKLYYLNQTDNGNAG